MAICTAPVYQLEELNNLFIELTSKNCNHRCSECYIDFPHSKTVKDFISIDKIKECISDTKNDNIQCIYLTGAEPMTHPDFNSILRFCLKRSNVCICTNGSFLNEKKIRFLKKVEDEGHNKILFQLTLAHYDEILSDKVRYRGNYRQNLSALKSISSYAFDAQLIIQNFYNLQEEEIISNFNLIFGRNNIQNTDIKCNTSYSASKPVTETPQKALQTDCMNGRILCQTGVYSCPFLANDYRGRLGGSFKNYSKNISAETDFCNVCSKNKYPLFTII